MDVLNHDDLQLVVAEMGIEVLLDSDRIRDTLYDIIHREIKNRQLESHAAGVDIIDALGVAAADFAAEIRENDFQADNDEANFNRMWGRLAQGEFNG